MYGIRRPCPSCGAGSGNFNFTSSNWNYNRINNYSPSISSYNYNNFNNYNNYRYYSPIRNNQNNYYNEYISFSPRPVTGYQNNFNSGNYNNYNYRNNNFERSQISYTPYRSISNQYNIRPMSGIYDNYSRVQNNNYSPYGNNIRDNNINRNYNNLAMSTSNYSNDNNYNFNRNAFTPERNSNNNINLYSSNRFNSSQIPNRTYSNFKNNNNNYLSNNNNNNYNYNNNNNFNYNNNYNNRYISNNSPEITFGYYDFASGIRQLIDQRKTFFILMYGSTDFRGVSWCSDCNFAEPLIQNAKRIVLSKQSERQVFWINIPIEKEKRHAYKIDSYLRMMFVPTLIYYENGIEIGRIVQEQMFTQESINNFISRAYRQYYY